MDLGKIIRTYRTDHDLSLREFADRCDLSHTYIDKLEKGVDPRSKKSVEPTVETVSKIASAMGMSLDELLQRSGYTDSPRANLNFWDRDTPPSDVELEDFLKSANIHFNGAPLNDEDKEDVLTYLKVKWEMERRKKKKADGEGS